MIESETIFQKLQNELIFINNKNIQLFVLIIVMNLLFRLFFIDSAPLTGVYPPQVLLGRHFCKNSIPRRKG